jgi:hypothetical protein
VVAGHFPSVPGRNKTRLIPECRESQDITIMLMAFNFSEIEIILLPNIVLSSKMDTRSVILPLPIQIRHVFRTSTDISTRTNLLQRLPNGLFVFILTFIAVPVRTSKVKSIDKHQPGSGLGRGKIGT